MTTTVATAKDRYLAEFEALERRGAFRSPSWLAPLRRRAIDRFSETGFPTTRDEEWRYTNVTALARSAGYGQAVTLGSGDREPMRLNRVLELPRIGVYRSTGWRHFLLATSQPARRLRAARLYRRLARG